MASAAKGMGGGGQGQQGPKRAGTAAPEDRLHEVDLAQAKKGDNQLQGDDQGNVRNQRHAQPDVKRDPDEGVLDSFEKVDKDERARRDLGKGARSSPSSSSS